MLDATHYDSLLDDQETPSVPCPVCTGDESAPPCSEECDALVRRCRREKTIRGLYEASRIALTLARVYRAEGPDRRLVKCLDAVQAYRFRIRQLRSAS